jgi:GxxExxY protein
MTELLHGETTERIIGAALEIHKSLGCGFLEAVYEEAMAHEMDIQRICHERQKPLSISYKGKQLKDYICDFLVEDKVLVELKAMKKLTEVEEAQVLNYLKASGLRVGLLFNFGESSLKFKRVVL